MKAICLNCGKPLFETSPVDDVHGSASGGMGFPNLESDGMDEFYRCPHCSAKNVIVSQRNPYGIPQLSLSHIKE